MATDSIICAHCHEPIVYGQSYANVPVPGGELRAVHEYCMAGRPAPAKLHVVDGERASVPAASSASSAFSAGYFAGHGPQDRRPRLRLVDGSDPHPTPATLENEPA